MKEIKKPLKLIELLADGEFHSGEQLGRLLGISRVAINKQIQIAKGWGLQIFSVTGRGYRLAFPLQLLDSNKINQYFTKNHVEVIPIIDSTNQYLLNRISSLKSGDACVAEYQQQGRGRRGKQWFSPFGSNLYLSMYWQLQQGIAAAAGLSLVVGLIIAEELQKMGATEVKVKWPNDLYLHDKKLAGILVELSGKSGDVANIVLGVGINLAMYNPDQTIIDQQWANLTDSQAPITIDRNKLVAQLLLALRTALTQFENEGLSPFIQRWDSLDNFLNRPVKLLIGENTLYGIARGINTQGALLLEQEGIIKPYVGGEISLRAV